LFIGPDGGWIYSSTDDVYFLQDNLLRVSRESHVPFPGTAWDTAGLMGAFGFGPSRNNPINHSIYEARIPFALGTLDTTMGAVEQIFMVIYGNLTSYWPPACNCSKIRITDFGSIELDDHCIFATETPVIPPTPTNTSTLEVTATPTTISYPVPAITLSWIILFPAVLVILLQISRCVLQR
jgi:hypothetical protein